MWKHEADRSHDLLPARAGRGPLIRRDYWAVIAHCRHAPHELMATVRRHFPAFAPAELAAFHRSKDGPIECGEEIEVKILGAGRCWVRTIHLDEQSLTLATEVGHPEAGRITFGAYRNRHGDVIFHIRSVARSSSRMLRTGFLATGEVMQTSTWTDFVNRVAIHFGDGPLGFIHAESRMQADEEDETALHAPTYRAVG